MTRGVAEWLHGRLPFRFIGRRANNALARRAWATAPDPEAPASVQRWWANGGDGATIVPPRFRQRGTGGRFAPFGPRHQ